VALTFYLVAIDEEAGAAFMAGGTAFRFKPDAAVRGDMLDCCVMNSVLDA
jgi:hypothetical protein